MIKQRRLPFVESEYLDSLWEKLPNQARDEVIEHYARLMARASVTRIRALRDNKENREVNDESNDG